MAAVLPPIAFVLSLTLRDTAQPPAPSAIAVTTNTRMFVAIACLLRPYLIR